MLARYLKFFDTRNMKLHKALKVKNRLTGELNRLQEILKRENSRRDDNLSKVDVQDVYSQVFTTREKLIKLKTAISKANIGIYEKISQIAELKAFINFIQSLPVREGEEIVFIGRDQEKLVYNWKTFLNREAIDKAVQQLQWHINNAQDEVDVYNANTDIEFVE